MWYVLGVSSFDFNCLNRQVQNCLYSKTISLQTILYLIYCFYAFLVLLFWRFSSWRKQL